MQRGTLFVLVDGRYVPIAPCTVERQPDRLGFGVFTSRESDRGEPGKIIDFHRIGTITREQVENIEEYDAKSEETASDPQQIPWGERVQASMDADTDGRMK